MQNDEPTQETPLSESSAAKGTLTPVTTAQDVPFHCSTRTPPPLSSFCLPTAMQSVAVVQDTAFSWFVVVPGAAWVFVHCVALTSARGPGGPALAGSATM